KQADFVAVISGTAPIEELYDHDYRRQLADWGAELGWRMGFEIAQQNEAEDTHQEDLPESSLNPENESPYLNFWMETFSQNETPFAAFVDESGKILWFGSPLRLVEAVTRWNKGELTPKWAASDLVFWYRLVASAAANERMAGAHVGRVFEGITTDGPNIEDDSVMLDVWEKTIESLNAQLPWRAHRWRVFEFRIATAKARQARHSAEMTAHVMDQFRKLTELFEESAPFSAVYLEDWKNVIKIAMDYMGLTSDSLHQPLDSSGLLALEGHPLTGLILDSVIRHDASIHDVSDMFMFQPRLSPAVFFKFNRFEEAVAEQQKMIDMFDAYARHQLQFMSSGDREDDQELTPEMLSESFLKMLLGEPPAQYRENLVKLRDHYQKFVEES
ncbi:MAG: hypothetical protein RJA81_1243, partial [Planctomycetota bacterium]